MRPRARAHLGAHEDGVLQSVRQSIVLVRPLVRVGLGGDDDVEAAQRLVRLQQDGAQSGGGLPSLQPAARH